MALALKLAMVSLIKSSIEGGRHAPPHKEMS